MPTTTSASSFARRDGSSTRRRHIEPRSRSTPTTRMRTTTSASCSTDWAAQREAALCFSKVITLRPKHPEARRLLALAHYTLGEVDKAIDVFDEWLRDEPDDPIARHMLAACSGRDVPARASDAFIETTFDSFAASFDAKLASLAYRAPALVAEMLAHAGVDPSRSLDVVDAGCGTGSLRSAYRTVRAAPGRGRPVRGDARSSSARGTSTTNWPSVS